MREHTLEKELLTESCFYSLLALFWIDMILYARQIKRHFHGNAFLFVIYYG